MPCDRPLACLKGHIKWVGCRCRSVWLVIFLLLCPLRVQIYDACQRLSVVPRTPPSNISLKLNNEPIVDTIECYRSCHRWFRCCIQILSRRLPPGEICWFQIIKKCSNNYYDILFDMASDHGCCQPSTTVISVLNWVRRSKHVVHNHRPTTPKSNRRRASFFRSGMFTSTKAEGMWSVRFICQSLSLCLRAGLLRK